jgi:hypothetical protein
LFNSNLLVNQPYYCRKEPDGSFSFITNFGVKYSVYFASAQDYFEAYPIIPQSIKQFGFLPIYFPPGYKKKEDLLVSITILALISEYFNQGGEALVFMCDMKDNKHKGRMLLFQKWAQYRTSPRIEKYDSSIESEGVVIYNSLLLLSTHPRKDAIIGEYYRLNQEIQTKWRDT